MSTLKVHKIDLSNKKKCYIRLMHIIIQVIIEIEHKLISNNMTIIIVLDFLLIIVVAIVDIRRKFIISVLDYLMFC